MERNRKRTASLVVAALLVTGCAAVEANRAAPGTLSNGAFTPTRPAATTYGPTTTLTCPPGGVFPLVHDQLAAAAKGGKAVEADPRLCAVADALLGWSEADAPRESVMRPLGWHFGIAGPAPRASIGLLQTEDARGIAQSLSEVAVKFAANAANPRFGIATLRVRKDVTKTVLVLQDATVDLDSVPRRVPAGATVQLSGHVAGDYDETGVVACSPSGKLERPAASAGKAFQAQAACGDRPGTMVVEIRGVKGGTADALARFPIGCGADLPAAIPVVAAGKGPADVARAARVLFDGINEERRNAGLGPVAWDDAVAAVARRAADSLRDANTRGGAPFDLPAALKQADIPAPLVSENPVGALTAEDARALVALSPVNRSNLLDPHVSAAGVGVSSEPLPDGRPFLYAAELLVRFLPEVDAVALRAKLRAAIVQKRAAARAEPASDDATLDRIAQTYASELAASRGEISKARDSEIVAPLYKAFRTVSILSGVKVDPMEFAEEPGVVAPAKSIGVGVAQGTSPSLGKNSVYVVVITATRR